MSIVNTYKLEQQFLQKEALQLFSEQGLPTNKEEDWKYAKLAHIKKMPLASVASKTNTADIKNLVKEA